MNRTIAIACAALVAVTAGAAMSGAQEKMITYQLVMLKRGPSAATATTPEGQKILDQSIPYGASLFSPGTVQGQVTEGKKISLVDWSHFTNMQTYMGKTFEAYGFPKAEK